MKDSASDDDFEPDMPPMGDAEYLLRHFWQIGPTVGDGAITSTELRNYQENQGVKLSPWECNTLRRLSIEYMNESQRATKRDCKSPWEDEDHQPEKILAAIEQRDAFRNLSKL